MTANLYSTIIGVTGYAQSGKDTLAKILHELYGFGIVSWADALRRDLYILDPIINESGLKLSTAMASSSYEQVKAAYPEFRRLLQVYGTEVHRSMNPNYWIERTYDSLIEGEVVVIPDVRFPNEAEACDILIRVDRPGVTAINGHSSDAGLAFDYATHLYVNDGTLEDMRTWADEAFRGEIAHLLQ
jgi:hypothetical protein